MRFRRASRAGRPSRSNGVIGGGGGGVVVGAGLAAAIDALGPKSWYKFDEANGNAVDYGSRGVNALPVSITGYRGVAGPDGLLYVSLDGTSDYFTAGSAGMHLDAVEGTTFAIAFRPTTIAGTPSLFSKMSSVTPRDYAAFVSDTGTAKLTSRAYRDASANVYSSVQADNTIVQNVWNFVVFRFNPSGAWTLFLNAPTENGTIFEPQTGTVELDGTVDVWIGALPFTGYRLTGGMAHFAKFDTALSDEDVALLMGEAISEGWAPA